MTNKTLILFSIVIVGFLMTFNFSSCPQTPTQKIYAFNEVGSFPSFPAGEKAFAAYIRKNVPSAASSDANGVASFVVDKYGNINQVSILRSAGSTTNAEAIKAFQNSPRWKPGTKNGEAVAVRLMLPFSFTKKIMENHKIKPLPAQSNFHPF